LEGIRQVNARDVDPPLPDTELEGIARSIGSYPPSNWTSHQAQSLNDTGNARRFVEQFQHYVRYVAELKQWIIWDGMRWRVDGRNRIVELAKETGRSIYAECAETPNADLAKA